MNVNQSMPTCLCQATHVRPIKFGNLRLFATTAILLISMGFECQIGKDVGVRHAVCGRFARVAANDLYDLSLQSFAVSERD